MPIVGVMQSLRKTLSSLRHSRANYTLRTAVRPALLLVLLVPLLLLALLVLGLPQAGAAQDGPPASPVVLTDEEGEYPLGLHLETLEDPPGQLTIQEIASPEFEAKFVPSQWDVPNFGYTNSAYWVRVPLRNESSRSDEWLLEVGFANMHYVDLHLPSPEGEGYLVKQSGALRPFNTRDVPYRRVVFIIPLPPKSEETIYLRFQNDASMTLPLTLWAPGAFFQHSRNEMLLLGAFYGALLIVLVYHLFLLVSLREASYLYFVLFLASMILGYAEYDGLSRQYIWPDLFNLMQKSVPFFMGLLLAFMAKFTDVFLDLKNESPRTHQLITFLLAVWGLLLLLTPFVRYHWLISIMAPFGILTLISVGVAGLRSWRQGYIQARIFVASWVGFVGGFVLLLMARLGLMPSTLLTEGLLRLGLIWLVACLSLALADRINLLKADTEQTNRKLRQSEHHLTQILEAMPVGVVVRALDTRLRFANRRAKQLRTPSDGPVNVEMDQAYTLQQNITDAPLYVTGTGQAYPLERLPPMRALGGESASVDDVEMDLGGRRIPLEIWSSPVFDEGGRVQYAVSAFQDISERVQAEARIRDRLAVEEMLAAVSIRFTQTPDLDDAILKTLEEVGQLLAFDRLFLVRFRPDQGRMDVTHEWCALGVPSLLREIQAVPLANVPWLVARLEAGETIYVEDVSQLPPEARREKEFMEGHLAGRRCAFPIHADAKLVGFLACHSYSAARLGPENERRVLETVVGMIGGALHRVAVLETLEQRVADRTQELSTLYHVTSLTSAPLPLGTTLTRALDAVLAALESPAGAIHLRGDTESAPWLVAHQGLPPEAAAELETRLPEEVGWNWVLAHDRPLLLLQDLCAEPQALPLTCVAGFQAYLGVPIHVEGEPGGVLSVFDTAAEGFTPEDMALLTTIADQLGIAIESDRLRGQAEEARVIQERQRLARDLHDAVSQSLYSLTLFAEAARDVFRDGKSDQVHQYLEQIKGTAHQALKEMRLLIYQLRPPALASEGLVVALQRRLEAVERRAGVEARLITHNGDLELPPPLEDTLYRLAQEGLNNVLKHAEASQVTVDLRVDDGWVELVVRDNGRGFDPEALPNLGGMGLANMRQRVEDVGGTLAIASTPGGGTQVKARIGATGSPTSEGEVSG